MSTILLMVMLTPMEIDLIMLLLGITGTFTSALALTIDATKEIRPRTCNK
ncbi:MAG: hypothetical protein NXY59_02755 [Aigarchaeota archaeon]|nr:hypothetical protein [Candidatus Pelearchaeum maunauluense]